MLVEKYHESNCEDKSILAAIDKAVNSSIKLRSKKELINSFVERVNVSKNVDDDWRRFVRERKEEDLAALIADEKLKEALINSKIKLACARMSFVFNTDVFEI